MTTKELLSRAEDYISRYAVDLNEARFSGVTGEDVSDIYEWLSHKLAGMEQLMGYLYRITEEEEE